MNFILYIKCTEVQDFNYLNPFYEVLKKEISHADFLDLDSFSGAELIDMAITAIEKSKKSSVVIDLNETTTSVRFLKLATYLADHPEGKIIFITGTDKIISKLLPPKENFSYHNSSTEEQLEIMRKFMH